MDLLFDVSEIDVERGGRSGQLLVYLFGREGFPKDHAAALQQACVPVLGSAQQFRLRTELSGPVAIKLVHDDEGSGGAIRKRFGFFPDMGIGYSQGARITWRVPEFREAAIELNPSDLVELRVPIRIQYLFGASTRATRIKEAVDAG